MTFLTQVAEQYQRLSLDKTNLRVWYSVALENVDLPDAKATLKEMVNVMPQHYLPSPAEFTEIRKRILKINQPPRYEPLPPPNFDVGKAAIAEMRRQYGYLKEGV